jgi:hypothetical protein
VALSSGKCDKSAEIRNYGEAKKSDHCPPFCMIADVERPAGLDRQGRGREARADQSAEQRSPSAMRTGVQKHRSECRRLFGQSEYFKANHGKRQRDRNCEHAERHQEDYFTPQRSRATIWPFGLVHLDGSLYSVDRPSIPS